jgi:hypothetical protein
VSKSSPYVCRRKHRFSVRECEYGFFAGYNYEGEQLDPKEFFESIDQLALAFSSRYTNKFEQALLHEILKYWASLNNLG